MTDADQWGNLFTLANPGAKPGQRCHSPQQQRRMQCAVCSCQRAIQIDTLAAITVQSWEIAPAEGS